MIPVRWTPPALLLLSASLHEVVAARTVQNTICFFGHTVLGKHAVQSLVTCWRGAALGSVLCKACLRCMVHEINDPMQPLIVANIPPLKKARTISKITGPCHFGHTHTSACDLNGTPCWFQMPSGITWNGAKPGVTLCNACIVKVRRRIHECEPCNDEPAQRPSEDSVLCDQPKVQTLGSFIYRHLSVSISVTPGDC